MKSHHTADPTQDAIEQLERAEQCWLRIDTLLRRLVTRLTYAAEGRLPQLDTTLGSIRTQVRKRMDEKALEPLLNDLAEAIRSLDNMPVSTTPPATELSNTTSANDLLLAILDRLQLDKASNTRLDTLREPIIATSDPVALIQQAEALAGMVNRHYRQIGEQKAGAERLLAQVSQQLEELNRYLTQESDSHREDSGARKDLDQHLSKAINTLGTQVQQANNLQTLQEDVQSRIHAITVHMRSFREREELRERAWQSRTNLMNQHIHELERTARDLEANLHQEHHLASTDPLTGIDNRLAFDDYLERVCQRSTAKNYDTYLLVLDIDHFKNINDQFGHAAGDRALRIVAEQLRARLRTEDLLARYGGEEFAVILRTTTAKVGMQVAETLRASIEKLHFRCQQKPVRITISCGVTLLRAEDTPASAFDRADRALYQAKGGGRNRCEML